jgi:hypothetical protein
MVCPLCLETTNGLEILRALDLEQARSQPGLFAISLQHAYDRPHKLEPSYPLPLYKTLFLSHCNFLAVVNLLDVAVLLLLLTRGTHFSTWISTTAACHPGFARATILRVLAHARSTRTRMDSTCLSSAQ